MKRRVKVTFRPDIDRTRITFPETKETSGEALARSGKGDLLARPGETVSVTMDERDYLRKHRSKLLPELLLLTVPATVDPVQIEIPETKGRADGKPLLVCRSRQGAIHVRPNSTLQITSDERDLLPADLRSKLVPQRKTRTLAAALRASTPPHHHGSAVSSVSDTEEPPASS